jgi:hypothetical protein
MSIPPPDDPDATPDLRIDLPTETDEFDAVEQRLTPDEPAPYAGGAAPAEATGGDLAESAREVPADPEERRRA